MKTAALDKVEHRVPAALAMQTLGFLIWGFWRAAGSMLIGMALYELGVFSAQRSPAFYTGLIAVGLRLGVPAVGCGVRSNFADDWGPLSLFYDSQRTRQPGLGGSGHAGLPASTAIQAICATGRCG